MVIVKNKGNEMISDQALDQAILIADIVYILQSLSKRDHIMAAKLVRYADYTGKLSPRQEAVLRDILLRNQGAFDAVELRR